MAGFRGAPLCQVYGYLRLKVSGLVARRIHPSLFDRWFVAASVHVTCAMTLRKDQISAPGQSSPPCTTDKASPYAVHNGG